MAYYETGNARYAPVRKLEATDWNHADVFNATIGQAVENAEALRAATKRIKKISIKPADWKNKQCRIESSEITEESLVDIYFSNASKEAAIEAEIEGTTVSGALVLSCESIPESTIAIDCIEIRNEVVSDAG